MPDNTNWNDRQESDSPSKDPQKGTPTDEFIETDPNRNAPDSEKEGAPTSTINHPDNETKPVTPSDDNPIMGTENTFKDTDPNRYNNNAGLGFPDKEKENEGDTDTIGIP